MLTCIQFITYEAQVGSFHIYPMKMITTTYPLDYCLLKTTLFNCNLPPIGFVNQLKVPKMNHYFLQDTPNHFPNLSEH